MYLEVQLESLCHDELLRKDKLSQWQVIKQEAVKKLETVCTHFPHFSKHDSSHSRTIGEQIGKLLGRERIKSLSCSDLMMLLACFYLHDVGMALDYEEIYERLTSQEFQKTLEELSDNPDSGLQMTAKRLRGFPSRDMSYEHSIDVYNDVVEIVETIYRSEHAMRSYDFVKEHKGINQCFGIRCQRMLAIICDLHQKNISNIMELPYKENGLFGDYFHPRFVASMLCLGDLMDLDTDRFDEASLRAVSPMPHVSKLHLKKHESVVRYLVDINEIRIKSNTDDISVYNVMRQWLDWIQEACEYISLHWSEIAPDNFGNAPRLAERELLLNNVKIRSELANLHYQISGKRMFKLMEGGGIYRNKLVCIREILQNAVDATIFRLFDEEVLKGSPEEILKIAKGVKWDLYKIEGSIVRKDNAHVEICVRDRGIGVSEADIYKIAHVSNKRSAHAKKLLEKMPVWFRPSGIFGIGVQSIFLLTDEFTMITKTYDESPKEITFQSSANGTGYIIVKEYNKRFAQGTEVHFTVDVTKMSSEELGCPNYYYKRKMLSAWFLKRVMLDYSNQFSAVPPIREIKKKKVDTVPIDLTITNFEKDTLMPLLRVEAFLSHQEEDIEIADGFVKTRIFFPELNCHTACNIYLRINGGHIYGKHEREYTYLHNTVFYRHEYVTDDCLSHTGLENVPLLPYIDWRIDLLDGETDEVLNLNRNTIREEYAEHFFGILLKSIKKSVYRIIDYLLSETENEDCRLEIKDTVLYMYQFARQYNYRSDELYNKFKSQLELISIGNYIDWKSQMQIKKKFNELVDSTLYFVRGEIKANLIPEEIKDKCTQFKSNSEEKNLLDLKKYEGVHILNHRAISVRVVRDEGNYLEIIEAVPFECLNPTKVAVKMDDMALLHQVLRMIKLQSRGVPVLREYEILATPINSGNFSVKYYVHAETYLIELPFEECQEKMYEELKKSGYVQNANDRYFHDIVNSSLYKGNVEYIKSYHETSQGKVEELYRKLIKKILCLMEEKEYKEYNQYILGTYNDPRISEYVLNGHDELESNCYLATMISPQEL